MLLSCFYLLGACFNILLRAGYAYRSAVNVHRTRWGFIKDNWDTMIIRVCVYGYGAFYVWALHPDLATKTALFFNVPSWLATWINIPVGVGSSFMFGFLIDVVLDSLQSIVASKPYLAPLNVFVRGRVPAYDANVVDVEKIAIQEDAKINDSSRLVP